MTNKHNDCRSSNHTHILFLCVAIFTTKQRYVYYNTIWWNSTASYLILTSHTDVVRSQRGCDWLKLTGAYSDIQSQKEILIRQDFCSLKWHKFPVKFGPRSSSLPSESCPIAPTDREGPSSPINGLNTPHFHQEIRLSTPKNTFNHACVNIVLLRNY